MSNRELGDTTQTEITPAKVKSAHGVLNRYVSSQNPSTITYEQYATPGVLILETGALLKNNQDQLDVDPSAPLHADDFRAAAEVMEHLSKADDDVIFGLNNRGLDLDTIADLKKYIEEEETEARRNELIEEFPDKVDKISIFDKGDLISIDDGPFVTNIGWGPNLPGDKKRMRGHRIDATWMMKMVSEKEDNE
jgi:hypothetical protein